MSHAIGIVIIDDHDVVRQALAARLCTERDFEVVAETANVETGLAAVVDKNPDIVLLDPKRTDGRGLELLGRLAQISAGARVVVLTSYTSNWDLWTTHRTGAEYYLLKDIDTAGLVERLRGLMDEPWPPATPK